VFENSQYLFTISRTNYKGKTEKRRSYTKGLDLLFVKAVLQELALRTKEKIASVRKKYDENKPYLVKETDVNRTETLIRLQYLSGEVKSGHEGVRILFPPKYGRSVFRATMSINMFLFPISCLRLERISGRNVRKGTNTAAAVLGLSNQFVQNCHQSFYIGC
jgi:hypothetical protein